MSTTSWLRERYHGHEIALKEIYPREYELWIDEKVYQNPNRILSRDERELWQLGRHIIDNLLPDEKHQIILRILEDFPYLNSFYFRTLSVSELNRLSENLQSNNRLSSLAIGSIVIGDKSPTSRGIVFSFSEEKLLVLWQDGFKSICGIEQLKLAPDRDKDVPQSAQANADDDWAAGVMQGLVARMGFDPNEVDIVRSGDGGVEVSFDPPTKDR